MHKYYLMIFCFVLALACTDKSIVFEGFETADKNGWNYKEPVEFSVELMTKKELNMSVVIRNTTDFNFSNLWLFVTTLSPSGVVSKDTISCVLADDYGYWLGKGFSGLYLSEHLVKNQKLFEKGEWLFSIEQGMREDTIQGIQEVGLVLKEIEK